MDLNRDQLCEKLGISGLSAETQDGILSDFLAALDTRIMAIAMSKLSDDDKDHLEYLMSQNDEAAVEWYIKSKFEHYDDFALQTYNEFIDEISANIKSVTAAYEDQSLPPASGTLNL